MRASRFVLAGLVLTLTACIDPTVKVRRTGAADQTRVHASGPDSYTVATGDTLYGIAFRYKLDFRELARINAIDPPYTIYPKQTLRLAERVRSVAQQAPVDNPRELAPPSSVSSIPAREVTNPPGVTTTPLPSNVVELPPTSVASVAPQANGKGEPGLPSGFSNDEPTAPGRQPVQSVPQTPVVSSVNPTVTPNYPPDSELNLVPPANAIQPAQPGAAPKAGSNGWGWPVRGRLLGTFAGSDPLRQGIDIAGTPGQAVYAAASGEVVYSGRGIIGYGELIVIKHDDSTLSAYGHNKRRLVKEGQRVKQGEQVAELGKDAQGRDLLHFEVRRNGKPVDPLGVLPRP